MANDPFDWDMSFAGKSIPNDYGQSLAYDSLLGFSHGAGVGYNSAVLRPQLATTWRPRMLRPTRSICARA